MFVRLDVRCAPVSPSLPSARRWHNCRKWPNSREQFWTGDYCCSSSRSLNGEEGNRDRPTDRPCLSLISSHLPRYDVIVSISSSSLVRPSVRVRSGAAQEFGPRFRFHPRNDNCSAPPSCLPAAPSAALSPTWPSAPASVRPSTAAS